MSDRHPTIDLRLFATLANHEPDNARNFPIIPGTTVITVLDKLGIPADEVKLIFINGMRAAVTAPLHGGERVGLFPPVGGG